MTESDECLDKVKSWLQKGGYPLEMRTMAKMRAAFVETYPSVHYQDPSTGKDRETDVVAWRLFNADAGPGRIGFVVECKSATDKPWVFFAAEQWGRCAPQDIFFRGYALNDQSRKQLTAASRQLYPDGLLDRAVVDAYGVTDAHTEGTNTKSSAYAAMQSASVAATALNTDGEWAFQIGIPIVVTAAPMYLCNLTFRATDDDPYEVTSIDRVRLNYADGTTGRYTTVEVYHESRLARLPPDAETTGKVIEDALQRAATG